MTKFMCIQYSIFDKDLNSVWEASKPLWPNSTSHLHFRNIMDSHIQNVVW
jgi:hypothetical protein